MKENSLKWEVTFKYLETLKICLFSLRNAPLPYDSLESPFYSYLMLVNKG